MANPFNGSRTGKRGTKSHNNKPYDLAESFVDPKYKAGSPAGYGATFTAIGIDKAKFNEHTSVEETIEDHLIPRKSTTTKQGLRLFSRSVIDSVELKTRQAEKIDQQFCPKENCGEVIPTKYDSLNNLVTYTFCPKCRARLVSRKILSGKMIEGSDIKILKLSDTTLLDKSKPSADLSRLNRLQSKSKRIEYNIDRDSVDLHQGEDKIQPDKPTIQLTDYEADRLGFRDND